MGLNSISQTKSTKTVEGVLFYNEESLSHVMLVQACIFKNGLLTTIVDRSEIEGRKFKFDIKEKYFGPDLILKITHAMGAISYFNLKPGILKRNADDPLFESSKYKTGYSFHPLETKNLEKLQQAAIAKETEKREATKENHLTDFKSSFEKFSQEMQAPNSNTHPQTLIRRSQSVGSL